MSKDKMNDKLIDKLHSKGIFDDSYDHLVLKQSDEDRQFLKEDLLQAQKKEKAISSEKDDSSKKTASNEIESSSAKEITPNFIDTIILFILSFFFGKSGKIFLLRKRTKKSLIQENAYYYDYRIKKLNADFADNIYQNIYLQIREIALLFEEIFTDKSSINYDSKIFLLDLVYPLLSSETKEILDSINEDYFIEIVANSENPEKPLSTVLAKLKNSIIRNDQTVINRYTREIGLLAIISQFDFKRFFKMFDYHFTDKPNYSTKFEHTFGKSCLASIKQLNSYFQLLNESSFTENTLSHFENTLNAIKKKVGIKENTPDNTKKQKTKTSEEIFDQDIIPPIYTKITLTKYSLSNLYNKITFFNDKKILESIIKLMTNDYDYKPVKIQGKTDILFNSYIELITEKQKYLLKKSFDKIKNSIAHTQISSLFNLKSVEELMDIENYTEEINRQLIAKGFGKYSYIEPIKVFKTFYHKKYRNFIQKIINTIIFEGDFIHKKEEKLFADHYYKLNKHLAKLADLELDFAKESKELKSIISLINNTDSDSQTKMLINKNINQLEKEILILIKEGTNYYKNLTDYLEKIKLDTTKLKPTIITNIKSIYGTSNKQLIAGLELSISNLKQFYKIIMLYPFMKRKKL